MGRTLPEVRCWLCPYLKYWVPRLIRHNHLLPTSCAANHVQNRHRSGSPPVSPGGGGRHRSCPDEHGEVETTPGQGGVGQGPPQTQRSEASRPPRFVNLGWQTQKEQLCSSSKSFLVLNDI